ncbi:alpha-L-rhamnosidase-like protein [Arcticibacter tournemirensis]|uniref:DNA-binding protein n=1 Tax=Arcticibacter tournemirensis TaxID=699437 RepID=A0A5M9HGY1_9SPHI|nr:glycosyl hydrolase [Arcticibacter tournemirensis]KAA8486266.1 DNA-binding protein [Arcticibacter tournemirensis]TQM52068.1 alpha-L-rhamnosidase-like protein [Arcticibacter tournemirensis]
MKVSYKRIKYGIVLSVLTSVLMFGRASAQRGLPEYIKPVGESAKSWVFWYWMHGAYSREGITADLEAMKQAGIAGAYLAPIKGKTDPPLYTPSIDQLSPEWWKMVRYALDEAARIGIKIAMLPNDGFATAGGPWITPENSMQKVVSSSLMIKGGRVFNDTLPSLPAYKGYFRDIAVFAFPANRGAGHSTRTVVPKVTTSNGADASFLVKPGNKQNFGRNDPCWIQYEFTKPFTCRSVVIRVNGFNYQSHRLLIEVSDDGKNFRAAERLQPPRAGWLDWDADVTHEIKPVTARFFRFVYNKEGSEPGAEDLDAAKWKPSLKIAGIELSSEARIHQYEGKTGEVWRVSSRTTSDLVPDSLCVPFGSVKDITQYADGKGRLKWKVPAGNWVILRVGYTSTGHMNETAGAGKGLECDKFNPEVVRFQFDKWFGEALRVAGPDLAKRVLNIFHVDSWECGSQNWSPVFREEFRKRRGYDPVPYLPVMTGVPVESADVSERFLYDIRQTISELIADNFFKTLKQLAHEKGATFTAEATAPVMVADGLLHFKEVDIPMGEFWLRSPSHDKPNDVRDAISGAHIYGKNVIQSEAFTEVRMHWDEHPGMLKALQDRNYALGINRLVYHVYTHNPWMDRKPGMTLNDVGLLFQRDQTWWKQGRSWVEYAERCQSLLQQGRPVDDIAVFTGEEFPGRAILPERLVPSLPGIFGKEVVTAERKRLENRGVPMREMPVGVNTGANMINPADWTDPLRGYAYDSFNADVLLNLAVVRNGRIELPGGASYAVLVLPGKHPMNPNSNLMSAGVAERLLQLVKDGATVVLGDRPVTTPGLKDFTEEDKRLQIATEELWGGSFTTVRNGAASAMVKQVGKGRVIPGPISLESFDFIGVPCDFTYTGKNNEPAGKIAWNHRSTGDSEIYFVSNQDSVNKELVLSFRVADKVPDIYDPVTGRTITATNWTASSGRTELPMLFPPNGSYFVIFRNETVPSANGDKKNWSESHTVKQIEGGWSVHFDPVLGGPQKPVLFKELSDWSQSQDTSVRYYSGTAVYHKNFKWKKPKDSDRFWLDLGEVSNIAEVKLNGVSCGIAWTAPYRLDITDALKNGNNELVIEVTNTWFNRMKHDQTLSENQRISHTTAPFRLHNRSLLKAGLTGAVTILSEK